MIEGGLVGRLETCYRGVGAATRSCSKGNAERRGGGAQKNGDKEIKYIKKAQDRAGENLYRIPRAIKLKSILLLRKEEKIRMGI